MRKTHKTLWKKRKPLQSIQPKRTKGFVVRIKLPDEGELRLKDKIQGEIVVKNKNCMNGYFKHEGDEIQISSGIPSEKSMSLP